MTIAIRLPFQRRAARYERRPRLKLDRRARTSLSRETRWKRRGGPGWIGRAVAALAVCGMAAALWFAFAPEKTPPPPPPAFPDFVREAEAAFPEALRGHTRARGGKLSDGVEVPVALTLLLPAHALESAAASPDALTRLSAPFVGKERAISGEEMGARIARLAGAALPAGISRCYTYDVGAPRRMILDDTRTVRVTPLEIAFNPEC